MKLNRVSGVLSKIAMCYGCDAQFYGKECPECGWQVIYSCWNCDGVIDPEESFHHRACGWYVCDDCSECGCNPERPRSNQEEYG